MDLKNLLDNLSVVGGEREPFGAKFERQRRGIGLGYRLSNDIRLTSKVGIAALKRGDQPTVEQCRKELLALWEQLGEIDVPADIAWRFDGEAGGEMVEFFFVAILYPLLFPKNAEQDPAFPSPDDLKVRPQTWLAGIGDATSEFGKLQTDLLCDRKLGYETRIALRERYLEIAKQIHDFLDQFETVYPQVINDNRYRGFGNGFRGLVNRIATIIRRESENLALVFDIEAAVATGIEKGLARVTSKTQEHS